MAMITIDELKIFAEINDDTNAFDYDEIIEASENNIIHFLGYDPIQTTYTNEYYSGDDSDYVLVNAKPITTLSSLIINEVSQTLSDYSYSANCIKRIDGKKVFKWGYNNIVVSYIAGYTEYPAEIKEVCKKLATKEIGINSGTNLLADNQSVPNGGSMAFHRTDYFLKELYYYVLNKRIFG